MNTRYIFAAIAAAAMLPLGGMAETVTVDAENSVIVLPPPGSTLERQEQLLETAADELQKHLALVTGFSIPVVDSTQVPEGKYPFSIGIVPAEDEKPIGSQESRWVITPNGAWFYGDTAGYGTGAQYAVYSFLEDQLGVHWIEPGDEGIAYKKMSPLALRDGAFNWIPQLVFRSIRQGGARIAKEMYRLGSDYQEFAEFQPTLEEHNAFAEDVIRWRQRVKMGGARPGGGHSFATWWAKYGEAHPEYFALNKFGKREPVPAPKPQYTDEFVKICPSNPDVADRIVADWLPKKDRVQFVGAGMNDGADNFCECANCKKLDIPREGERFADHLTDRYVHLANAVARKVREHRPDAYVAMYAYLNSLRPPRKLNVEPNVVVQVVPYVIPLESKITEDILGGWRRAGATMIAFRPNYHTKYLTITIPIGVEKQMFEVFQTAVRNGCVSADYDSLVNHWPVTGLADYILAKAMSDPSKPFEHWKNQYYSAFGAAAGDVARYFDYWREQVWEKRLLPNIATICDRGGAGNFTRGLLWSLGEYYTLSDFETTDAFLDEASKATLTPLERERLNELRLANQHARLTFQAITAAPADKSAFAEELLAFRKRHRNDLRLQWLGVFGVEIGNGDLTGMKLSKTMKDYLKPWLKTDLFWRFKLDPDDTGLREKWQEIPWEKTAGWDTLRTDRFWERQFAADEKKTLSEAVANVIERYDGLGWYVTQHAVPADWKGRKIFLRFGAVDESCWIYLNGKFAGEHLYKERNDWKTPFEIRIDELVDWNREKQLITVRVEDKAGVGGIWRSVWLVSKAR